MPGKRYQTGMTAIPELHRRSPALVSWASIPLPSPGHIQWCQVEEELLDTQVRVSCLAAPPYGGTFSNTQLGWPFQMWGVGGNDSWVPQDGSCLAQKTHRNLENKNDAYCNSADRFGGHYIKQNKTNTAWSHLWKPKELNLESRQYSKWHQMLTDGKWYKIMWNGNTQRTVGMWNVSFDSRCLVNCEFSWVFYKGVKVKKYFLSTSR